MEKEKAEKAEKAVEDFKNGRLQFGPSDLTNDAYHQDSALGSTKIKEFHKDPYLFHFNNTHPLEEQPRYIGFGTAMHSILLERAPYVHDEKILKEIGKSRASKEYKEWRKSIEEVGHIVLSKEEALQVGEWKKAIRENDFLKKFISPDNLIENSFFCTCPKTLLSIKCRPDVLLTGDDSCIIVDIKTTNKYDAWSMVCESFRYDIQQAFYEYVLSTFYEGKKKMKMFFIVFEKVRPYKVRVCRVSDEMVEVAHKIVEETLEEIAKSKKTGDFGSPIDKTVHESFPSWKYREKYMDKTSGGWGEVS